MDDHESLKAFLWKACWSLRFVHLCVTKQQLQKMLISSYVNKYKEISYISVARIHKSGSFLSHHSYPPSFPTSGGIAHINA